MLSHLRDDDTFAREKEERYARVCVCRFGCARFCFFVRRGRQEVKFFFLFFSKRDERKRKKKEKKEEKKRKKI